VSLVPVYFSHSYRRTDRDSNEYFWRLFFESGFSFTVDPQGSVLSTTRLEIMMARSAGFVGLASFREEEQKYQCSPFLVHEFGLAVRTGRPRIVLRDKRVSPRFFRAHGTIEIEFDPNAPDRCIPAIEAALPRFRRDANDQLSRRPQRFGRVGAALAENDGMDDLPPGWRAALLASVTESNGSELLDLNAIKDNPVELAQSADCCDFVVVDVDDSHTWPAADFLVGRGTPLLKVARRGSSHALPDRYLGDPALRIVSSADETIAYWHDAAEFAARVTTELATAIGGRVEFVDFESGHRYFRGLGRRQRQVFISNASSANPLAGGLTHAVRSESIPFFHYRFNNTIGLGERWASQLGELVAASHVFIALIDGAYWASDFCRQEYETAERLANEGRILLIPCLLEGVEDDFSPPQQGIDLRGLRPEEQIATLVSRLDEMLASDRGWTAGHGMGSTDGQSSLRAGKVSVDVAIITILKEEYESVLGLLENVRPVLGTKELPNMHSWVVGEIEDHHGRGKFSIGLAISPHGGTNLASIVTKNTLQALDAESVLIVGIAGGLTGCQLGDVVVADRICAYEYGKIDDGGFQPRQDLDAATDSSIYSAARTLASRFPDWHQRWGDKGRTAPRILVGKVASGDKVVDQQKDAFFARVLNARPDLTAVEMEGAGAAAAVQDAREMHRSVGFGMIRGISDLPKSGTLSSTDGAGMASTSSTEVRDNWKVTASQAAAEFAVQLISLSWPSPPSSGTVP
jgi:nucleoside phosphorylase